MTQPTGFNPFSTLPCELVTDILDYADNDQSTMVCKLWNALISTKLELFWQFLKDASVPAPYNLQGRMEAIEQRVSDRNNYLFLFRRLVKDVKSFYGQMTDIPFSELQCTQMLRQLEPGEVRVREEMNASLKAFWFHIVANLMIIGLPDDIEGICAWFECDKNRGSLKTIRLLTFSGTDRATYHLPHQIGRLVGLEELCINHCQLRELPIQLRQLTSLKRLQLFDLPLREIPPEIGELTALQELDISRDGLLLLPSEMEKLTSLQVLDASANVLRSLPAWIGKLVALRSLDMANNEIIALPAELGNLRSLETLRLDRNPLMFVPDNILQSDRPVFASNAQITQLKEERRFVCTAPLAQLFQAIILKQKEEKIKEIFAAIQDDDKLSIFRLVLLLSKQDSVIDLQRWGEAHVFDDMDHFYRAVRTAIIEKYLQLPTETRGRVNMAIRSLAGASPPPTQSWVNRTMSWLAGGSSNQRNDRAPIQLATQNITRLAEAMDQALQ